MNIEIIAIGNEILTGMTTNTNAAYLSRELMNAGFSASSHVVLPDERTALKEGLQSALHRSSIIIATGGLGATCDDNTKEISAELFNSEFYFNQELFDDLERRYGNLILTTQDRISLQDQAKVPIKSIIIKNSLGTAPGFIFHANGKTLILLPGVPSEMKEMFRDALEYIKQQYDHLPKTYHKFLYLFNLAESAVDPTLRELKNKYPLIQFGIYTSFGLLTLQMSILSVDEKTSAAALEPPFQIIFEKFKNNSFYSPSGKIEEALQQLFISNRWSLSMAESCTGGSIAAKLTRIPGSSKYFLGSLVVYSNDFKIKFLNVSEQTLNEKGAVSEEVAEQMVCGILEKTESDWGIAVSGIAGPDGGSTQKPVGTICAAVAKRGHKPFVWTFLARGSREMIIERTINALLCKLYVLARDMESTHSMNPS